MTRIRWCMQVVNACLLAGLSTTSANADELSHLEQRLEEFIDKKCDAAAEQKFRKAAQEYFSKYRKEKSRLEGLTGSIEFGARDDSGDTEKTSANASIDATFGGYPNQLRVGAKAEVEFEDDAVTDNLSKLSIEYDSYLRPDLELVSFVNRSTNSFMGIEERYEIGFGLDWEWDYGLDWESGEGSRTVENADLNEEAVVKQDWKKWLKARNKGERLLVKLHKAKGEFAANASCDAPGAKASASNDAAPVEANDTDVSEALGDNYNDYKTSREHITVHFAKRRSVLNAGISAALLAEFEEAEAIDTTRVADMSMTTASPTTQVDRVSIRPWLTYRLTDGITFSAEVYWKQSIDDSDDVRLEQAYSMEWQLAPLRQGSEKQPNLKFTYELVEDEEPPNLDGFSDLVPAEAEDEYRSFRVTVKIPY